MLLEIVEHLYSFKDDNWHSLNGFLKSNYEGSETTIREALVKLVLANRIRVREDRHIHLNNWKRINDGDYQNTYTTLDNWILEAKITLEEREKIDIENRNKKTSTIYQPVFNGPANAVFSEGKFHDLNQTINESKKVEKAKWLTWNFYWEEMIKLGWKWIIVFIVGIVCAYFGFNILKGKEELNKSASSSEQNLDA